MTGDGCDDLLFSESGPHAFDSSPGGAHPGWLNLYVGCTEPVERRIYEDNIDDETWGIGQYLEIFHVDGSPVVMSHTAEGVVQHSGVEFLDFTVDPIAYGGQMIGENQTQFIVQATMLEREQTELVISDVRQNRSGPGAAFLDASLDVPDVLDPTREWYAAVDAWHIGQNLGSFDRTGDGLEELYVNTGFSIPDEARAGEFLVLTEPGLENAREVWHGDPAIGGYLFGLNAYGAPDLPAPGDRGMLVGSETIHDGGALYLLPPVPPGEYTLADTSYRFQSEYPNELFGSTAAVGDVNADGEVDVIVGAPMDPRFLDIERGTPGKVYVFLGPFTGPVLSRSDARVFVGTQRAEHFGTSVALSDLDNDGTPEIYVGASSYEEYYGDLQGQWDGALYRIDL